MWYRVFGLCERTIEPGEVQATLRDLGVDVPLAVRGDELGWTRCEIPQPGGAVVLERYQADADDIRDELDSWAAWLETQERQPGHLPLMQRVIGTRQLITLRVPFDHPEEQRLGGVCEHLARFLANRTDGVYQIDTRGFYTSDGTQLITEA